MRAPRFMHHPAPIAPTAPGAPIVFVLPIRTENTLNGSQGFSRGAVMAAARKRKDQRALAEMATRPRVHGVVTFPLVVTLTRLAPSAGLDTDGLAASQKSIRDGVADGLGLVNDRDSRVTWVYDQRRTPRSMWGVEVSIEART